MIKSNELRISNYILRNGLPCTVEIINGETSEIHFLGKDFYFSDFDENLEAIPLTEEWLLKFGFTSDNFYDDYKLDNFTISSSVRIISTNVRSCFHTSFLGEYFDVKIDFVHQLQNLYFSLTNNELNIQL